MARTRSENYEGIQIGILARAAALFAAQGYERSSITDLVDACNLSRGALYHYFDSKEAILFSLLRTHVSGLLSRLRSVAAQGGPSVEKLTRLIETMVVVNAGSQHEQVILLNDLGSLSTAEQTEIRSLEQGIVDLLADALVNADRSGRVTRANRKLHTMILLGIINYTYTWYDPQAAVKPEAFARIATDIFLNGFLSAEKMRSEIKARPTSRATPETRTRPVARRKA